MKGRRDNFLPPADKVCEGYVLHVCVCPQRGVLGPRGVLAPEAGCLVLGEVPHPGGGAWSWRGEPEPGQYASYWNAFLLKFEILFKNMMICQRMQSQKIREKANRTLNGKYWVLRT